MSTVQGQRARQRALTMLRAALSAYRPSFISALLSQVHVDVQQGERLRELTLIHCDKNENTSLWKCHFSFAALLKVLHRNMMSHFLWRAALWEWETVCDIVSRHIDPHCGVKKTYCTSTKTGRLNSEHLNKNLFPPLDWPNRFLSMPSMINDWSTSRANSKSWKWTW